MADFTSVGKVDEFPRGGIRAFSINGRPVCVVRVGSDLFAFDGLCTHQYVELSFGYVMEGQVICGQHEAAFDLKTGEVLGGPAEFDLAVYEVKVEGDEVFVGPQSTG